VNITIASELYPYRSYLETLLTYCPDAASSHLTNAFWCIDGGDVLAGDPTSTSIKNKGFARRWERHKENKIIELYGRLHADICIVSQFLLPKIFVAHNEALSKGKHSLYNLTSVELKTFTYAGGPQVLSINNAVLGALPKRLIFTMVKNTDFLGSRDSNPYNFRHFDLTSFTMYVNGRFLVRV